MQLTSGQTNMMILLTSIVLVYFFYPQYVNIITPIFIAITLYFSSDATIASLFDNTTIKTPIVSDFIIKYKIYIIAALSVIGLYFTNELLQSNNIDNTVSDLTISDTSSYSSTKLLPKKSLSISESSLSSLSDNTLPSLSSSSTEFKGKLRSPSISSNRIMKSSTISLDDLF